MQHCYHASKVINQIDKFGKSFKSMTLETVKGFLIDSKKSNLDLTKNFSFKH